MRKISLKNDVRGFTLLEVLVSLALLGVLLSVFARSQHLLFVGFKKTYREAVKIQQEKNHWSEQLA